MKKRFLCTAAAIVICCIAACMVYGDSPQFRLQRGPLQRHGLPISNTDLSAYLFASYTDSEREIDVYLADRETVQQILQRQKDVWERRVCAGGEYYRGIRYGREIWIPVGREDLLVGIGLNEAEPCDFLALLQQEMSVLRRQPDFNRDPFPAVLPMPN